MWPPASLEGQAVVGDIIDKKSKLKVLEGQSYQARIMWERDYLRFACNVATTTSLLRVMLHCFKAHLQ
jgi:hypothetical protein